MARLRPDFSSGKLSAGAITSSQTNLSSTQFANLPTVASPDYLVLVLDPYSVYGAPERVTVTTHTASSTAVTVTRGSDGTLTGLPTRTHNSSGVQEDWIVGITDQDFLHGTLANLGNDDHTQYYNSTRHSTAGAHTADAVLEDIWPTGTIMMHGGAAAPTGFLFCDGTSYSATTYSDLYSVLGSSGSPWGVNTGAGTFQVPDLRGRVGVGAGTGSGLSARTLGPSAVGTETHALSIAELAAHSHTQAAHNHGSTGTESALHTHSLLDRVNFAAGGGNGTVFTGSGTLNTTSTESATHTHATSNATATNANTGSGTAHNNMQPFAVVNYIIKY